MSKNKQHYINRAIATRSLEEFRKIKTPGSRFYYLRQLDPFVFEELILTALNRQGYRIIRNKAYTGDGGVDGMVFMNMKRYLIQAKRYEGHIKAIDIDDFIKTCKKRKVKGLFIHTGRTGSRSRGLTKGGHVTVLSGQSLLNLLSGQPFRYRTKFTNLVNRSFEPQLTHLFNCHSLRLDSQCLNLPA